MHSFSNVVCPPDRQDFLTGIHSFLICVSIILADWLNQLIKSSNIFSMKIWNIICLSNFYERTSPSKNNITRHKKENFIGPQTFEHSFQPLIINPYMLISISLWANKVGFVTLDFHLQILMQPSWCLKAGVATFQGVKIQFPELTFNQSKQRWGSGERIRFTG